MGFSPRKNGINQKTWTSSSWRTGINHEKDTGDLTQNGISAAAHQQMRGMWVAVGRQPPGYPWMGFTVSLAKIWRLLKYCIWFSHMKRNSQGIFLCHVWLPEGSSCSFFPWFMDDMDDYDDWNANPWGSRHHEGPVELWWPPLAADLTTIADLAWSEGGHWQKAAACNMEMRTCRYWTDQQVIETG